MKFILLFSIMAASVVNAQSPKETVQAFFKALNEKNADELDALMTDDLKLHTLNISPEVGLSASEKEFFIKSVREIPAEVSIEERIFDLESIQNEHIAQVWVPYEFYVNGTLSHTGVNAFTMVKLENGWIITSITDTRNRQQGR